MVMSSYAIGVDVGGTWTRVSLIDTELNLLKKAATRTSDFTDINDFLTSLKMMIDEVDETKLANQVGLVIPAPWKDGMTHFKDATNVPFLEGIAIDQVKQQFPQHTIFFENDVNVVAMLESRTPERKALASLMYITVSSGIGSGMIINGQLWQGAKGYAGEVGNMIIPNGEPELVVVLEDVCSGLALDVAGKSLYGEHATAKTLFEAYEQGDAWAIDTIEAWLETFTDVLASLMHVINPDVFVLGGGVITNNEWLIEVLNARTRTKLFENLRAHLKIELTHYGEDSGLLGGALLCFAQK